MSAPCFFVAGATGYTGRALVPLALSRGARVVAHIRPGSARLADCGPAYQDAGATLSTAPWRADDIRAALEATRPTHVFALLGTSAPRRREAREAGQDDSYDSVDRDLTLMLYEACARLLPHPRFVYLSSLGADRPTGAYLRARHTVETVVQAGPVPFTIARPSFISGEDRPDTRPGERLGATVADGVLGALAAVGVSGPRDRFASMTGEELARALVAAALDDDFAGAILAPPNLRQLEAASHGQSAAARAPVAPE